MPSLYRFEPLVPSYPSLDMDFSEKERIHEKIKKADDVRYFVSKQSPRYAAELVVYGKDKKVKEGLIHRDFTWDVFYRGVKIPKFLYPIKFMLKSMIFFIDKITKPWKQKN